MNILDDFYETLDWHLVTVEGARPFFSDTSYESLTTNSHVIQVFDELELSQNELSQNYFTPDNVEDEEIFLKNSEDHNEPELIKNSSCKCNTMSNKQIENRPLRAGELQRGIVKFPKLSTFCRPKMNRIKVLQTKLWAGIQLTSEEQKDFEDLHDELHVEQMEFAAFARQNWMKDGFKKHNIIIPGVKMYIDQLWQAKIEQRMKEYPLLYKQIMSVPLVYNFGADTEDNEIVMVPGPILHSLGEVNDYAPKITTSTQFFLCNDFKTLCDQNPLYEQTYPTVSRDPVVESLVQTTETQVVISSSGLKCLLDNQCTDFTTSWMLPVNVREYTNNNAKVQRNEKVPVKKVVFIDKKLPPKSMGLAQRISWHSKIATRPVFFSDGCEMPCADQSKVEPRVSVNSEKLSSKEVHSSHDVLDTGIIMDANSDNDSCDIASDMSEKLVINYDSDVSNGEGDVERKVPESTTGYGDEMLTNKESNKHTSHKKRCYMYQQWNLGKQSLNQLMKCDGEVIPVIIRSRIDCVTKENKFFKSFNWKKRVEGMSPEQKHFEEQRQVAVHLSTKLEYQYEYGAEKLTNSQVVREWTDSFIRPNAVLVRVRINPLTGEIIQTEKLKQHDLKMEARNKNNLNVTKLWSSLYSVLSKLITLSPGNYFLDHSNKYGSFTGLFAAIPKQLANSVNLYSNYQNSVEEVAPIQAPWIPLDCNLMTPMCIYKAVLPMTFPLCCKKTKPKPSNSKLVIGGQQRHNAKLALNQKMMKKSKFKNFFDARKNKKKYFKKNLFQNQSIDP